jgi:hypothetical protein
MTTDDGQTHPPFLLSQNVISFIVAADRRRRGGISQQLPAAPFSLMCFRRPFDGRSPSYSSEKSGI